MGREECGADRRHIGFLHLPESEWKCVFCLRSCQEPDVRLRQSTDVRRGAEGASAVWPPTTRPRLLSSLSWQGSPGDIRKKLTILQLEKIQPFCTIISNYSTHYCYLLGKTL